MSNPPWWDAERGCYREEVEEVARIIDPEAFGLPAWTPSTGAYALTERDEARDKAIAILSRIKRGEGSA